MQTRRSPLGYNRQNEYFWRRFWYIAGQLVMILLLCYGVAREFNLSFAGVVCIFVLLCNTRSEN